MHLSRLRLVGFKSFVEPTELVISTGLTGVVGPNGCGKSNLLEALRWVMGESSYKSMRGSAMDDVIFAGTATRPARNSAEVTLFIDNTEQLAPVEFNDTDQIEVSRRIEREAGSAYRINGRETRARDVKILFEDASAGARSPALVRQGQIAEIINAKPENRRRILEDAAGVAGLHTRRHEAELRLKAAEANLARLDDVMGGLNAQAETLKRQARQARRYRDLSQKISTVEALALHLAWREAHEAVEREDALLRAVLEKLSQVSQEEAQALRLEAELGERLHPLREELSAKAAAAARVRHDLEAFEREAVRQEERAKELLEQVESHGRDKAREEGMQAEAVETVARLNRDIADLQAREVEFQDAEERARKDLGKVEETLGDAETKLNDANATFANESARRSSLLRMLDERRTSITRIDEQLALLDRQEAEIEGLEPLSDEKAQVQGSIGSQETQLAELEVQVAEAERVVGEKSTAFDEARTAAQEVKLKVRALQSEAEALRRTLAQKSSGDVAAILDSVDVAEGYETALGAALGDDLEAPVDASTSVHWRLVEAGEDDPELPSGVSRLSDFVTAPPELTRRLAQIGLVDAADGPSLQTHLLPGQRLVTREGMLWRWDGFVAVDEGVNASARRLEQRNRLSTLEEELVVAERDLGSRSGQLKEAEQALQSAKDNEQSLRTSWRGGQRDLGALRQQLADVERKLAQAENKLSAIAASKQRALAELEHAKALETESQSALEACDEALIARLQSEWEAAQKQAQTFRSEVAEKRAVLTTLHASREEGQRRLKALGEDLTRWNDRAAAAEAHIESLEKRIQEARGQLGEFDGLADKTSEGRQKLLDALSAAEVQHKSAADQVQQADTDARQSVEVLRALQAAVSATREARAGHEARLEAFQQRCGEAEARIREVFDTDPQSCLALAELPEGAELPELSEAEQHLAKLRADRERLGGVNLQADSDLERITSQVDDIATERADVQQAIDKLRQAISQLNREGRRRINEAFETVNGHFGRLFETLFGGGEAQLEISQSEEDPLQGRLEIIAKPPGKKPATLSLLSGGEQTLTALALIFAVFLTNPSPICVLDEVDAPLDDANVDRFCTLMESMADDTQTRFLVITHHPMTMTRMNRLFGVTMAEKGVSQLVSVDLETAQGFREAG
ncbi:MAG: chromosome segregation protein SMC [Filomicrobium sp.]